MANAFWHSRLVLCFGLFVQSMLYGMYSDYWSHDETITLKKDQYYSTFVTKGDAKKPLHIKWTLYINALLTIQVNYDGFNHQFLLTKNYQENYFRLPLFAHNLNAPSPFLMLEFLDFDANAKQASLQLRLHDALDAKTPIALTN